ncbi:hypothetical protein CsatB_017870 [Cannabis sativa]
MDAATPEDAVAKATKFVDRILAKRALYKNVFPVPPGPYLGLLGLQKTNTVANNRLKLFGIWNIDASCKQSSKVLSVWRRPRIVAASRNVGATIPSIDLRSSKDVGPLTWLSSNRR